MPTLETKMSEQIRSIFEAAMERLRDAGAFEDVTVSDLGLYCKAKYVESEAFYRGEAGGDGLNVWVGLYTPDRWLSESIEAHLMHIGDKLEDLLEEELVDLGVDKTYEIEHFRDEQLQYVFRSAVALPEDRDAAVALLANILLGYEAMFRQLGDMEPIVDS